MGRYIEQVNVRKRVCMIEEFGELFLESQEGEKDVAAVKNSTSLNYKPKICMQEVRTKEIHYKLQSSSCSVLIACTRRGLLIMIRGH